MHKIEIKTKDGHVILAGIMSSYEMATSLIRSIWTYGYQSKGTTIKPNEIEEIHMTSKGMIE